MTDTAPKVVAASDDLAERPARRTPSATTTPREHYLRFIARLLAAAIGRPTDA